MSDPLADYDADDPEELVLAARDAALDALRRAEDLDDPIETATIEQRAVSTFAEKTAAATAAGYSKSHAEAFCKTLSRLSTNYTKANIVDLVEDERAALEAEAGPEGGDGALPVLDHWIEAHLESVVRVETTDHRQDTVYRWHFDAGTVETERTKDGVTHFSWSHFRDQIYLGLDVALGRPERREAEAWRAWIASLMDERGETKQTHGPRSQAVEDLQDKIARSVAYAEMDDAVERGGVWMDAAPADDDADADGAATDGGGEATELRVMASDIKRIADDAGLDSVRALQNELDARGYTLDTRRGVSDRSYAAGGTVRVWVLSPDIATPGGWVEDPESPADGVMRERREAEEAETTDDGVHEPGAMGSLGVDPDDLPDAGDDGDEGGESE